MQKALIEIYLVLGFFAKQLSYIISISYILLSLSTHSISATETYLLPNKLKISHQDLTNHGAKIINPELTCRPSSILLKGKIIPCPEHYAQVHVSFIARVIADSRYPSLQTGSWVKKGQVVAVVQNLLPPMDETTKRNELYRIEAEIEKKTRQLERLKKLKEFSAKKKLENTQINLSRAQRQREELSRMLSPQFLQAPIEGIIISPNVFPGYVSKPEDPFIEIINPGYFNVLAYNYNCNLSKKIKNAYLRNPNDYKEQTTLKLKGIETLVDQNFFQHLIFSPESINPNFIVGMLVDIILQLEGEEERLLIPQEALELTSQGARVYILKNDNYIVTKYVKVGCFIDDRVEILEGLKKESTFISPVSVILKFLDN